VRRACMGWTPAALPAGSAAASRTMTMIRVVVAARVTGSYTVTP
jgi:hypothetical protein